MPSKRRYTTCGSHRPGSRRSCRRTKRLGRWRRLCLSSSVGRSSFSRSHCGRRPASDPVLKRQDHEHIPPEAVLEQQLDFLKALVASMPDV
eukprot:bmy_15307T0